MTGAVTQGHRGELAAQIVFLAASDAVCSRQAEPENLPGSVITVRDLLIELLPSDHSEEMVDSLIPFGSGIRRTLGCHISSICPNHSMRRPHASWFVVMPAPYSQKGDMGYPCHPIRCEYITPALLMIQVKNSIQDPPVDAAMSAMLPSAALREYGVSLKHMDTTCVRVYVNFGRKSAPPVQY